MEFYTDLPQLLEESTSPGNQTLFIFHRRFYIKKG